MKKINQFIKPIYFKTEKNLILEQLTIKNNYTISYDLKEVYNHVFPRRSRSPEKTYTPNYPIPSTPNGLST
jgi:hypothetical protein